MNQEHTTSSSQGHWLKIRITFVVVVLLTSFIVRPLGANETGYPALTHFDAVYVFSDGNKVVVHASVDINRGGGMGLLIPRKFALSLSGQRISEKKFNKLVQKMVGIKFETIQISQEYTGDSPDDLNTVYTISFDYWSQAFVRPYPAAPFDTRKKMSIEFDKSGIQSVNENAK